MTMRVSREPERPLRFHRQSGWGATRNDNSLAPGGMPTTEGSKPRVLHDGIGSWKNFKRVETDGGESERPIISLTGGNHPRDPVEIKGRHVMTPLEGNMAGASKPRHYRVPEPTTVAASGTRRVADSLGEPSHSEFMI